MPRAPRFRIAVMADLLRQLRFVSRDTRLREMKAAEALLADIDPDRNYPADFVTWRITGYRPEARTEPVMLVGDALVGDLATLIQRLSDGLGLPADHDGRVAVPIEDVARELNVSPKTIQRYRRQGLVCHYVRPSEDANQHLACFRDALDRFVARHRRRVVRASAFTRIPGDFRARIIEEARALRRAEGVSLNEAAARLARAHGRAQETIRNMLQRHDRTPRANDEPIFGEHGPLTDRDMRVIYRAMRRNVAIEALTRRFGKSETTIRRAYHRHRGDRLRRIRLTWIELPTFALEDAESIILEAPAVNEGLDVLLPADDAIALIAQARAAPPLDEALEDGLLAGYNALKRRAAHTIEQLGPWPRRARIDAIRNDLDRAVAIKRRLVSLGLPAAIVRIEQNLHRPLAGEPTTRIIAMLRLACDVVARTIEQVDPGRGQRLVRLLQYAMDRALAGADSQESSGAARATARHAPGSVVVDDLYEGLVEWQGAY